MEYQGTAYLGWQFQDCGPSIQGDLEKALGILLRKKTVITAPSRTDAGVHARGQLFTFLAPFDFPLSRILPSLNALTPKAVTLLRAVEVPFDFHPRKAAKGKFYRYQVQQSPYPPAIHREFFWWKRHELQPDWLQQALRDFLGEHDFTPFRSKDCQQPSTIKRIFRAELQSTPILEGQRYDFIFGGSGFLRHQIRLMVGALVLIGEGKLPPDSVKKALAGTPLPRVLKAPPQGLILEAIQLDPDPFQGKGFLNPT